MHPDFKPPRASNSKQWAKIAYLIERGYRFVPVYNVKSDSRVSYPKTLVEAKLWAEKWKDLPAHCGGPGEYGVSVGFNLKSAIKVE
jgi:hypothetical protein